MFHPPANNLFANYYETNEAIRYTQGDQGGRGQTAKVWNALSGLAWGGRDDKGKAQEGRPIPEGTAQVRFSCKAETVHEEQGPEAIRECAEITRIEYSHFFS